MPPKCSTTRKPTQGNSRVGRSTNKSTTCKTCSSCRQKKIKCSGVRPQCDQCNAHSVECVYPRDARREPRPSRALFQNLAATMSAMLDHMQTAGTSSQSVEDALRSSNMFFDDEPTDEQEQDDEPEPTVSVPLPTPAASTTTFNETPRASVASPLFLSQMPGTLHSGDDTQLDNSTTSYMPPHQNGSSWRAELNFSNRSQSRLLEPAQEANSNESENQVDGLSPCEARVAGVFHEHGCVSSVHGLAGIMNPTRRALHKENISKVSRKGEAAVSGSKARLISNAILQKQREYRLFRQPHQSVDLDGCDPDLARHLISLHFNRHHCSYLITYRPAIMEGIATGGPWVNKLLLNAIYYNSSLYSERQGLRSMNEDPESVGSRFYDRFCQLLIDAMSRPSVPSAVALLLTSATLVAQGKVSAGWSLSGTAYRMIIDLGCHLMLGPDYQEVSPESGAQMLQKDIDHEMRKRLYWGAYITDVTQSLYLGRQCSFATTEARVPLQLLDTFEEMEEWEPYIDPVEWVPRPPTYSPQPVYAVSSFSAYIRLMQIGALVSDLYGISTVSHNTHVVLNKKVVIESRLENWITTIPDHLTFDPEGAQIPPPHQITLHTTFNTLRILLYRAFLEEGHLRRHSDPEAKKLSEQECIASALVIEKYIRAYRRTFTLRRAPLLLSYAIYSAVAIILPQERHDRGHFTDIIAFFWTCLGELQHGCNFGLKKPLSVLRDMAREFQLSAKERGPVNTLQPNPSSLDASFFPQLPLGAASIDTDMYSAPQHIMDSQNTIDPLGAGVEMGTPGLMNFLNDQEWSLSQNTLYGLFAPNQPLQ